MKGKDGQTSIFLIIGIVLVIVVMIALIMRGPQNKLEVDNEIKKIDIRDIKFYLEECISDEVKMMIPMVISESGLYTKGRNETINLKNKSIGYYLFHDNLTVPNSSQIANMIRFFALDITSYCVLQFEEVQRFEDNWVNYYEVEVEIGQQITKVDINFEIISKLITIDTSVETMSTMNNPDSKIYQKSLILSRVDVRF